MKWVGFAMIGTGIMMIFIKQIPVEVAIGLILVMFGIGIIKVFE